MHYKQGKRANKCSNKSKVSSAKLLESLNKFNELKEKYFQSQPDYDQKQRSVSGSVRKTTEVAQAVNEISCTIASGVYHF